MLPSLAPGKVFIASILLRPKVGRVVVIKHGGLEKIKRITKVRGNEVFLEGDNSSASTDSRQFGWVKSDDVLGVVIMPRSSRRG